MAEKKIQENPLPEEQVETSIPQDTMKPADKPSAPPMVVTPPQVPSFTKTSPNDMYRRLLPAVLFLLTFVTVMTMLLIYMDTVALGAQQFRLNMSRDYELARIPQESAPLVAYVRQLHLQPRAPLQPPPTPRPTPRVDVLDRLLGPTCAGCAFVEFLPQGPRDETAQFLEAARHWDGVVVRAKAKDYLALRGKARALHACLSPTDHPREVTYHESDSRESAFSSRVLCLPLYTVLLAADATRANYVLLGGDNVVPALQHVPFDKVHLQVIEYFFKDIASLNATTTLLAARNYGVVAVFADSIMYALKPWI